MKTFLKCLAATLLLLAIPELITSGLTIMFTNPCFFRQYPPAYCETTSNAPNSLGVALLILGLILLAALIITRTIK